MEVGEDWSCKREKIRKRFKTRENLFFIDTTIVKQYRNDPPDQKFEFETHEIEIEIPDLSVDVNVLFFHSQLLFLIHPHFPFLISLDFPLLFLPPFLPYFLTPRFVEDTSIFFAPFFHLICTHALLAS